MKNFKSKGSKILALAGIFIAGLFGAATANAGSGAEMKKIGTALEHIYMKSNAPSAPTARAAPTGLADALYVGQVSTDGYVMIDAIAADQASDLAATIKALGGRKLSSFHRTVSAEFPASQLGELAASNHLAFARPVIATTNVGLVTSQGDRSMRTDLARATFGFDGSGLTVGVLSDSFSCEPGSLAGGPFTTTAEDIANGDLPADITILSDFLDTASCIDEGRAMAQLIHDVVPGAAIAFHTAFNGEADFAQGIIELAEAGADVIVDDIIYVTEPMFQDGIIAQAADEVARLGVPYYSSNGNRARDAFQSEYRAVDATIDTTFGTWHDFDEGAGTDLLKTVTLNGDLQTNLTFQWDNPNFSVSGPPGAQTDVDVVMFDSIGVRVANCFDENGVFVFPANGLCQFQFTDGGVPTDGGNGGDAVEFLSLVDFIGGSTVQLGLLTESGVAPGFVKYVLFAGGFSASEYPIDAPSGFGHNNAAGAEGVGAAAFYFTEEFIGDPNTDTLRVAAGEPPCIPACLNDFSSAGGTPIFFDTQGNRLPTAEVRLKPGLTGPDGGNTSFFFTDTSRDDDDGDGVFETGEAGEFPNFFGTSAAAPHAAAVAALLIDSEGTQIKAKSGRIRMCKPDNDDDDDDEGRDDGDTKKVRPDKVSKKISKGWLLGPCSRTEPQDIYDVMRATAQDMTIRASNATGATVMTFDEIGPDGFDFDSGFGFIDAEAALIEFTDDDEDDDDDDDDDDEDEDEDEDDDEDDDD